MTLLRLLALVALVCIGATPAAAQLATVVASCPSTGIYAVGGGQRPILVDVNGQLCTSSASVATIADGADVAQGTTTDAACSTDNGTCTELALLKRANQRLTSILTAVGTPIQATGGIVSLASQYPSGATAISASATGTTGATTATLAGTSGKTTYICGFSIRANATAAATGNATVTGPIGGTLNFTQWTAPLASGLGINEQVFVPCLPASATNTGIAIISAAPGAGGTGSVTGWGYQL